MNLTRVRPPPPPKGTLIVPGNAPSILGPQGASVRGIYTAVDELARFNNIRFAPRHTYPSSLPTVKPSTFQRCLQKPHGTHSIGLTKRRTNRSNQRHLGTAGPLSSVYHITCNHCLTQPVGCRLTVEWEERHDVYPLRSRPTRQRADSCRKS